jgi:site-specific DNA-methyltransferase (adenine-specific)
LETQGYDIEEGTQKQNIMQTITINHKFHALIPPMAPEELAQLEANILADGCRDPLVVWKGVLVDGHNRFDICTRHGLPFKTVDIEFADSDHAELWIRFNQLGRRNLTDDQRAMIGDAVAELESKLAMQERAKAGRAAGGKATEEQKSDRLEATAVSKRSDKPKNDRTRAKTAKAAKVSERKMRKARAVRKKSPELAAKVEAGEVTLDDAIKQLRTAEVAEQRAGMAAAASKVGKSDRWHVYQGDVATWGCTRQYDFIITDPPYPKEFLPLYETLAVRALEWLKDGGLLIAMCGQSYLDEVYAMMSKHLTYYWTACYRTPGQPTPLRQVNVNSTWKPLLIYSKGKYKGKIFGDVFVSDGNDKENHKWGQSVSGMLSIVSGICLPGQYILDPFCGAGTTGIASIKHGCLFDGLELDAENVNISKARLNEV